MAEFPSQLTSKGHLRIKAGGYLAVFDRDFCQGAEPLDFIEQIDKLMDEGQILKNDSTSYVSRVRWNGKDVVVKRYNHRGFIHSLRHTIKKSRAYHGWLHTQQLGALNIATPRSFAYVEQHKGLLLWESYLVTEYVRGQNLYYFLRNDNVTEEERSKKIKQILELLDKMSEHRVSHGDLKHTNILITENGPVLTDLDAMKIHRWNWPYKIRRAKDLKRFLRKTDVSPELNSYCRTLIVEKMNAGGKFTGDFDKMRMYNWTIYARKDVPKNDIRQLVLAVDKPGECRSQFVKVPSSDYSRVFRCNVSFKGTGDILYLKQYLYRSAWDFVKHLFRSSRAKRAFKAALMLQRNGFDVPAVIAMGERKAGCFNMGNFLVTFEVKDAKDIYQLISERQKTKSKEQLRDKRELIRAFGQTIGQVHSKGIFHGDLRLGNVLARRNKNDWRFFFLDNERTRKFLRLPNRLRLKNLVQVNMFRDGISRTDRLRFFKPYLEENPDIQSKYKILAGKVVGKTRKRLKTKLPTCQL